VIQKKEEEEEQEEEDKEKKGHYESPNLRGHEILCEK